MTGEVAGHGARVRRWTPASRVFCLASAALLVLLGLAPLMFDQDVTQKLTTLLTFAILAAMWNALAGYGGLVSVGQQAFVGIGAYTTIVLAGRGLSPYVAMVVAALVSGAIALPLSLVALRLRAAQFAIGMWVIAEVFGIVATLDGALGGGTGISLLQLDQLPPAYRQAFTYWTALGLAALLVIALFALLRSRMGISLQAIRDDEQAATSLGVRVAMSKRVLFVLAGAGCGAAGAITAANTHFIQPTSVFGVQWTAYMVFMVLVGGLGTFEGPFIGAVLLFAIQTVFSAGGPLYLIGLGATAAAFAVLLPRGIWGTVQARSGIWLTPVGYRVRQR